VTHHDGVGGVVQLLGQIADEHRHRKFHDALPWRAHGHVMGAEKFFQLHKVIPFHFKSNGIIAQRRPKNNRKIPSP
jgi:hypothetical protein